MINEILFMNGFGTYVWSSFIFTLSGFFILYLAIKIQLVKEQKKFDAKLVHTHTFNLIELPKALKYARERIDDAIKIVIKPWY